MSVELEQIEPEHPWERYPTETERQFQAFTVYRDQAPPRSLAAVGEALEIGVHLPREWSAMNGWRIRAAAYDAMLDRERVRVRVKEVQDMERRHAQAAAVGLNGLTMPFIALTRERVIDGNRRIPRMAELEAMHTADLVRLAARSGNALGRLVGVERLSRGEPTEIISGTQETPVDAPSTDEDRLRAIFAAMEEAGLTAPVELGPAITDAEIVEES